MDRKQPFRSRKVLLICVLGQIIWKPGIKRDWQHIKLIFPLAEGLWVLHLSLETHDMCAEPKAPPDQGFNLTRISFWKCCHLPWLFRCSSLMLVLPAITANPPVRFHEKARDCTVISYISADLSCSTATALCLLDTMIYWSKKNFTETDCMQFWLIYS